MLSLYDVASRMLCGHCGENGKGAPGVEMEKVVGMVIEEIRRNGSPALDRLAAHDGEEVD